MLRKVPRCSLKNKYGKIMFPITIWMVGQQMSNTLQHMLPVGRRHCNGASLKVVAHLIALWSTGNHSANTWWLSWLYGWIWILLLSKYSLFLLILWENAEWLQRILSLFGDLQVSLNRWEKEDYKHDVYKRDGEVFSVW